MANKQTVTRYIPFEQHESPQHSNSLPLPNVVRIEVLSTKAKARYLGPFHSMLDTFRQELTQQLMDSEANKPFYAFFNPEDNGDIGFDMNAGWNNAQHIGLDAVVSKVGSFLPKKGALGLIGGAVRKAPSIASDMTNLMGLNNNSTGSVTMKEFSKAEFQFNKSIQCSWYMPEQEDMARLSISRLLRMAYVRNFNKTARNQYAAKVSAAFSAVKDQMTNLAEQGVAGAGATASAVGRAVGIVQTITDVGGAVGDAIGLNMDNIINGAISLNEYFGGSLTINPLPVRLTLGHILDIEPLVITGVSIKGSKEQFMTTDGTNIPLFVTANIQFSMWMIPDPQKGFVQWLGDNIFHSNYLVGVSSKAPDNPDGKTPVGNNNDQAKTKQKGTAVVGNTPTAKAPMKK